MNYYEHHIGDFLRDTAHLSSEEECAYRRMMDFYYLKEGPLPLDTEEVARKVRMRDRPELVAAVLNEFFTKTQDGWHHARCDAELDKAKARIEAARKKAEARWGKSKTADPMPQQCRSNAAASPQHDPGNALHIPHPTSQHPTIKKPRRAAPRQQIPDGFALDEEMAAYAETRLPDMDVPQAFSDFRDYHLANGTVSKDWRASWRTWVNNCTKGFAYAKRRPGGKPSNKPKLSPAEFAKLMRERNGAGPVHRGVAPGAAGDGGSNDAPLRDAAKP